MILHNDRPEDLETPVRYFDSWVTPIDAFFVRQHLPRPAAIDRAAVPADGERAWSPSRCS